MPIESARKTSPAFSVPTLVPYSFHTPAFRISNQLITVTFDPGSLVYLVQPRYHTAFFASCIQVGRSYQLRAGLGLIRHGDFWLRGLGLRGLLYIARSDGWLGGLMRMYMLANRSGYTIGPRE